MSKIRNSNYELLRILSMFLIIAHHYSVHGIFNFNSNLITFERLWIQFLAMGGKIGVNIFVLISGYFLITSSNLKTIKIIRLLSQLLFYSVTIYLVCLLIGNIEFDWKDIIEVFFPITYQGWWFASTYFVLYIFSPFINKFLLSLNQKEYKKLLLTMFFCWCLIPTIFEKNYQSNYLLWFSFLYALAGYIKLFGIENERSHKYYFKLSLIGVFLTFITVVIFDFIGIYNQYYASHATRFYSLNTLPILFISLSIFICFKNINIENKRWINKISSTTFGIYLIHDHDYIRVFLWENIFRYYGENSYMIIIHSFFAILVVFIICMLIELIRSNYIDKKMDGIYNWTDKALTHLIKKIEHNL